MNLCVWLWISNDKGNMQQLGVTNLREAMLINESVRVIDDSC